MIRKLGNSDIRVSAVAMGCWPIAGMTSLHVNDIDSVSTLRAAIDSGITHFDTAYIYGANGESETLVAKALNNIQDDLTVATKCGARWQNGKRIIDGKPANIISQCETSLARLNRESIDLYYLHWPDPDVPVEESAIAMKKLIDAGKIRTAGLCNCTLGELERFHNTCPTTAVQLPFNVIQQSIQESIVPWCIENSISVMAYWPLMKGLLAGKLSRDHIFEPNDKRQTYSIFQGNEWEKNQDFLDELRSISKQSGWSITQLVVNWTIHQSGITAALCGAKRPEQIAESASAMKVEFSKEVDDNLRFAIANRRLSDDNDT